MYKIYYKDGRVEDVNELIFHIYLIENKLDEALKVEKM